MFAGGCRWRSLAVDGSSGASRGHAPVVRRPGSRWGGAVERPSANQAGHIPSWHGSCERYALSLVADGSRWLLLLLLSPLLSAAGPVPISEHLPGTMTAPCPAQAPPPKPTAAGPDGRRVLSRGGAADHAVTPQAPLTGSGCCEHSYGGFGGGYAQSRSSFYLTLGFWPGGYRRTLSGHLDPGREARMRRSGTMLMAHDTRVATPKLR
jgi:hypothetical protein